jgi:hypothetical protein
MPLVRIFARLPEYPTELVRNLRTRGFEVETCVSTNGLPKSADLEITVDQYSPEAIAEVLSGTAPRKDVYILADSAATGQKIRSIGMLLLNSEATAHKTVVPAQLIEIYTALLHERQGAHKAPLISLNWVDWIKLRGQCGVVWKRISDVWPSILAYSRRTTVKLGQLREQAIARTPSRSESPKLNCDHQETSLRPGINDSDIDPELVPSIFNLSARQIETNQNQKVVPIASPPKRLLTFSFTHSWKPLALGAIGVLAIAFSLQGFFRAPLKAIQASSESKTEVSSQTQKPVLATQPQSAEKVDKPTPALRPVVPNLKPVASKMLAKPSASDDNDYFDKVVIRHYAQPAANTVVIAKPGIKRRVVVN